MSVAARGPLAVPSSPKLVQDAPAHLGLQPAGAARKSSAGLARENSEQLGLSWLLKLRWGAVAGQLVALLVARMLLDLALPYALLLALVGFTAASNALCTALPQPHTGSWRLPLLLTLDIAVLTAMLALSGGASNPFTVFFLVHVALSALLLEARWAWAVVALTIAAFGGLFLLPQDHSAHMHDHGLWAAHLSGMWLAYALAAGFVVYFVGKVSRAMRQRDRQLAELVRLAAQNERLATLSSFSANAAHELGSPLATISLAAKELALGARRAAPDSALVEDAELVCREVLRCREILADLSARAGESVGEMPMRTNLSRLLQEVQRLLTPAQRDALRIEHAAAEDDETPLVLPLKTVAQMLCNLIRNAFEAQQSAESTEPVELRVELAEQLQFLVLDQGLGISEQVRAKLGEPFVTTKSEHGGLGLGVYLARSYAERTGGSLQFHARAGGGTAVSLRLPRNVLRGCA